MAGLMNEQYAPGGSQGTGSPQSNEAIARELSSLKQALDHLAAIERDLESQRIQLQAQITRYTEQAPLARRANRHDLANEALARVAQLQPALTRVQEQLGRVAARQKEITSRQFDLLRQISGLGSGSPPYPTYPPFAPPRTPAPRKPRKRRRLLIGLSLAAILLLLTGLGLGRVLRSAPGQHPANVAQAQPGSTSTATPFASPTPIPQIPPFRPDGTGPTTRQCQRALGYPCYSPEQIQQAFNLPALYRQGYDGAGQTIVILGAGKTTTLQADLHYFDHVWGLPDPPSFKIIEEAGPPAPYICPYKFDELQVENTLDVEWAHAIAPGASIVLVIGSNKVPGGSPKDDCGLYGLVDALNYALDEALGQVVTISYSESELGYLSETASRHAQDQQYYQYADTIFRQAAVQQVTVLSSSGDEGATNYNNLPNINSYWSVPNVGWPADDPYVLAVGGTTLQIQDASGTYGSERVWNDWNTWHGKAGGASGGGLSADFTEPDYQQKLSNQAMLKGKRGVPDVAFPAEPNYDLYASFETGIIGQASGSRWRHWDIIGGTSAASPCWAGLIAIANQMRGKPLGFIQPALYSLGGKGLHDITSGNNSYGGVNGYGALPGYDLSTGWGTPIADQFLPALIAAINDPANQWP